MRILYKEGRFGPSASATSPSTRWNGSAALRLFGWSLDVSIKAEIDRILSELIKFPVGPEFMAPSARS
jgi:hypothetical protein